MKNKIFYLTGILLSFFSCTNKKVDDVSKFTFNSGVIYDNRGEVIASTLDQGLQKYIDSLLRLSITSNKANSACAMVMDTETGAIKAMVHLIPNSNGKFSTDSNFALNHYYEFGGVFKLYTSMVLLEDDKIKNDSIPINDGSMIIGNAKILESNVPSNSKMTFDDAFINSSNIVFAKLAYDNYKLNPENFMSYFTKANLAKPLKTDITTYNSPSVAKPGTSSWDSSSLQFMSIGYGIKLSPLQILTYYNSIANNGELVYPYFADCNKKVIKSIRVCKPETAAKLQYLLSSTWKKDTIFTKNQCNGSNSGKSGTVNNLMNGESTFLSSYVGYFPASKPRYTCLVLINNPQNGSYYGSTVAGPIFDAISCYLK